MHTQKIPTSSWRNKNTTIFALMAALFALTDLTLTAEAHTKFFCTKLALDSNTQKPTQCLGNPNEFSHYVHVWGPRNEEKRAALTGKGKEDECMLEDLETGKRPASPGIPSTKTAIVRQGDTVTILWPRNNHTVMASNSGEFALKLWWEGNTESISSRVWDQPTPSQWKKIELKPVNDVKCIEYEWNDVVGKMVLQNFPFQKTTSNERVACYRGFQIPKDMPTGLNRVLLTWNHSPNDGHFFESAFYYITPSSSTPTIDVYAPSKEERVPGFGTSPMSYKHMLNLPEGRKLLPRWALDISEGKQVVKPTATASAPTGNIVAASTTSSSSPDVESNTVADNVERPRKKIPKYRQSNEIATYQTTAPKSYGTASPVVVSYSKPKAPHCPKQLKHYRTRSKRLV